MPDPPDSRNPSPTRNYGYGGRLERSDQDRTHRSEPTRQERFTEAPCYTRHLPQSKSDGNVKSFEDTICEDTAFATKLYGNWGSVPNRFAGENDIPAEPSNDRRGRHRSRSPAKKLEDVDEDNPLEFLADTPRKRSRSPHKKLFGENGWLGRSADISKDNKRTGFKGLGERLKQRVEDIVSSHNQHSESKN